MSQHPADTCYQKLSSGVYKDDFKLGTWQYFDDGGCYITVERTEVHRNDRSVSELKYSNTVQTEFSADSMLVVSKVEKEDYLICIECKEKKSCIAKYENEILANFDFMSLDFEQYKMVSGFYDRAIQLLRLNERFFILQKDSSSISVNTFVNNEIKELQCFELNSNAIYTTDEIGRIAILDTAKRVISIIEINSFQRKEVGIPFNISPECLLMTENSIFIGGEMRTEMLIQYDLDDQKWHSLHIPNEIRYYGKSIDDLLINDTLLIAVDDIVLPKYILYYKLGNKGALDFSHSCLLKANSSYERARYARNSPKYLGLYSTTMNWGVRREHITIYSDLALKGSFALTSIINDNAAISDFLIYEDRLYIANRFRGFGVLEMKKDYFKLRQSEFDNTNAEVDSNNIRYEQISEGEVIKLTRIPNERAVVLTIRDRSGHIRNELRDL